MNFGNQSTCAHVVITKYVYCFRQSVLAVSIDDRSLFFFTLLQKRDLMNAFKLVPKTFVTYLMHVEDHYRRENPYHNSIHAADVVQSSHVLLSIPFFEVSIAVVAYAWLLHTGWAKKLSPIFSVLMMLIFYLMREKTSSIYILSVLL